MNWVSFTNSCRNNFTWICNRGTLGWNFRFSNSNIASFYSWTWRSDLEISMHKTCTFLLIFLNHLLSHFYTYIYWVRKWQEWYNYELSERWALPLVRYLCILLFWRHLLQRRWTLWGRGFGICLSQCKQYMCYVTFDFSLFNWLEFSWGKVPVSNLCH